MAEYAVVPEVAAFDIDDISFPAAAMMEPLSCVLHGVQKLGIETGERAIVFGAGPIGLMIAQCVMNCGASAVVADRSAWRLEFARRFLDCETANTLDGFGEVEKRAAGGYDAVIDATGAPEVIKRLTGLTRRGGRILLFGVAPSKAMVRFKPFELLSKELSILSSYTSLRNSEMALALIRSGRVRVERLISHTFSIDEFKRAVNLLGSSHQAMKIQLVP